MPIIDIQRRLAPAGRIRIGEQVPTSNGKTRPAKLSAFRFTSSNKRAIEGVAGLYGGTVTAWEGAPTEGQWEVYTETSEIPVVVPPERMSFSQYYEVWSGGGCKRRCDGEYDLISEGACLCDPENRQCKPHTRISVMLAKLSGIGLWRLDTKGFYASEELGGSFDIADMLSRSLGRSVLPGILRLEQRVTKREGKTNKFAVPVLDFDVDMGALALGYSTSPSGEMVPLRQDAAVRPGLSPVPADSAPVPSVADQMAALDEPKATKPRANAAAPIQRTGLAPKGAQTREPTDDLPPAAELPPTDLPAKANRAQKNNLHRLYGLKGIDERAARLEHGSRVVGRKLKSSNELTPAEADQLIAQLKIEVGEEPDVREEQAS